MAKNAAAALERDSHTAEEAAELEFLNTGNARLKLSHTGAMFRYLGSCQVLKARFWVPNHVWGPSLLEWVLDGAADLAPTLPCGILPLLKAWHCWLVAVQPDRLQRLIVTF